MTKTSINSEAVRQLAALLEETGLHEIEYEAGGLRLRVSRGGAAAAVMHAPAVAAPAVAAAPVAAPAPVTAPTGDHPGAVKAPMVGVTYLASEPSSPPFVQVGQTVSEGQTLLLIEAMKTFNPVRAPRSGKLTAMLVSDGQPVEYGEPLAVIE